MADDFITVYYSTNLSVKDENPFEVTKLFSELINDKTEEKNTNSYLSCPAVSSRFKKTLVVKSTKYSEHIVDGDKISPSKSNPYHARNMRDRTIKTGATFEYHTRSMFFADQPLDVLFTAPYFHKAGYTNYASVIPGSFDIGSWFRPFNFEVQSWIEEGKIIIKKGEPLFYLNFLTDKKIVMKEFKYNYKFSDYSDSLTKTSLYLRGQGLESRYDMFEKNEVRAKIMEEINNNLLDTPDIIL